jgi:hypothetical protein
MARDPHIEEQLPQAEQDEVMQGQACPVAPRRYSISGMLIFGLIGAFIGIEAAGALGSSSALAEWGIPILCAIAAGALGLKMRFG